MKTLFKLTALELKLFLREPINMVFTFALPLIFLFVMGGVFGNQPDTSDMHVYGGVGAMNYYVPAYFALILTTIGVVSLPVHLAGYRERGILRRLHASNIPATTIFGVQLITTFLIAVVGCLLVWGFGKLTHPDLVFPSHPWLVLAAFALGTLCFTSIGVLLGALLPSTRSAQGLGLILFFVMMILGGAGPPLEVLTGAMKVVSNITPIHYVIGTLQSACGFRLAHRLLANRGGHNGGGGPSVFQAVPLGIASTLDFEINAQHVPALFCPRRPWRR
jgi:ABC-2 type transport system permease protein